MWRMHRLDRLCLLQRQIELGQPLAPLDPEQVRDGRAAHEPSHEHRVDLVLREQARTSCSRRERRRRITRQRS